MTMTEAEKSLKYVKTCLAERLAPRGFIGAGDVVWRKLNDTIILVEVQKDRKYSTRDAVRFTINVCISADALRDVFAATGGPASSDIPSPERCHWRQRLGHLLPVQSDVWWSVHNEQSAHSLCGEIASGLIDTALPKVEAMASSVALVRSWREGRGQGLSEYERRVNLARLLLALGRIEEAQEAVQALKEASLGKSWAASAAFDVKELRKQF